MAAADAGAGAECATGGGNGGASIAISAPPRRSWIPRELAYGNGTSRSGAPTGMLVFDVELLEILAD